MSRMITYLDSKADGSARKQTADGEIIWMIGPDHLDKYGPDPEDVAKELGWIDGDGNDTPLAQPATKPGKKYGVFHARTSGLISQHDTKKDAEAACDAACKQAIEVLGEEHFSVDNPDTPHDGVPYEVRPLTPKE